MAWQAEVSRVPSDIRGPGPPQSEDPRAGPKFAWRNSAIPSQDTLFLLRFAGSPPYLTIATMPPTTPSASIEKLDPLHRDAITAAVLGLLDTALARETFGQIIDCLPLCHIAYGQRGRRLRGEHPILRHVTLCPGMEEAAVKFRSDFEMEMLAFKPEVGKPHRFLYKSRRPLTLHSCSTLSKPQIRARVPSTYA